MGALLFPEFIGGILWIGLALVALAAGVGLVVLLHSPILLLVPAFDWIKEHCGNLAGLAGVGLLAGVLVGGMYALNYLLG